MDKNNIKKEYSNGEVTIVWQSGKCTHSGNCVRNNPDVFQPKEKPWIKPMASTTDKIIETVKKCPSGALSYYINENQEPENYDNLIEAIAGLKAQGYTEDFNLSQDCLICNGLTDKIFHDEFEIDKYFRFDGQTDPDDESVIYAISSERYNIKGILINGYGTYSDDVADSMLNKLNNLS